MTTHYVLVLSWPPDELAVLALLHQRAQDPPFGPPMISESNVAASSFSAEWLADTRHVNIDVLEFASAVFALLLWALIIFVIRS